MRPSTLAVSFVLVSGLPVLADERPTDATISRHLVGTWTTCMSGGSSTKVDGTICYTKDCTFVAAGKVMIVKGEYVDVHVEGKWKVEEGSVLLTVTQSSHPGIAPVDAEVKEKVISIDEKVLRVRRGIGAERERKRVEKDEAARGNQ